MHLKSDLIREVAFDERGLVRVGLLHTVLDQFISVKYTVKPAHTVTSIKQSPVLKGHIFLVLS
jgi:hypothetical protein